MPQIIRRLASFDLQNYKHDQAELTDLISPCEKWAVHAAHD